MKRTFSLGFAALLLATTLQFGTAQQAESKSLRSIINSAVNSINGNRYGYGYGNPYGYGNSYGNAYGYGYGNGYGNGYYNNPYGAYGYNNYGRRSVSSYLRNYAGWF